MSVKHDVIDVRVSKRILWFGSEAYPLPNITRTNTLKWEPNRPVAIRRFVISTLAWLFAASIVATATPGGLSAIVFVGVVAWRVYRLVKLIEFLNLTLYELVIETAAGSNRGLVSADGQVVTDLSFRITDAINNPHAEFQQQVNIVQNGGEMFHVSGSNNVGKAYK
ncbi:MAG: DUF6232 family protein [Actinophytocola sp.]|uniref:DUF6232 family protein n=1 Tax=Actinophytocola sp. TaxID=1872138 RepID=UPI003C733BEB